MNHIESIASRLASAMGEKYNECDQGRKDAWQKVAKESLNSPYAAREKCFVTTGGVLVPEGHKDASKLFARKGQILHPFDLEQIKNAGDFF